MRIGVPREIKVHEYRVGLVPAGVRELTAAGHEVFVECVDDFAARRRDPLILDCGANIGMAALFFVARFPAARVVSVEPHPQTFRLLEANTRPLLGVECIEAAVTEHGGPVRLYSPPGDGASLVSSTDRAWGGSATTHVAGLRLSELIGAYGPDIDLLKLDVEGAEYGLLRECGPTGALRGVREVVLEYHRVESEPGGCEMLLRMLRQNGFDAAVAGNVTGRDGIIRARRR